MIIDLITLTLSDQNWGFFSADVMEPRFFGEDVTFAQIHVNRRVIYT